MNSMDYMALCLKYGFVHGFLRQTYEQDHNLWIGRIGEWDCTSSEAVTSWEKFQSMSHFLHLE